MITMTIHLNEKDLKDLIAKSIKEGIGREIDPQHIIFSASQNTDCRGESYGHTIAASVSVSIDKLTKL